MEESPDRLRLQSRDEQELIHSDIELYFYNVFFVSVSVYCISEMYFLTVFISWFNWRSPDRLQERRDEQGLIHSDIELYFSNVFFVSVTVICTSEMYFLTVFLSWFNWSPDRQQRWARADPLWYRASREDLTGPQPKLHAIAHCWSVMAMYFWTVFLFYCISQVI